MAAAAAAVVVHWLTPRLGFHPNSARTKAQLTPKFGSYPSSAHTQAWLPRTQHLCAHTLCTSSVCMRSMLPTLCTSSACMRSMLPTLCTSSACMRSMLPTLCTSSACARSMPALCAQTHFDLCRKAMFAPACQHRPCTHLARSVQAPC